MPTYQCAAGHRFDAPTKPWVCPTCRGTVKLVVDKPIASSSRMDALRPQPEPQRASSSRMDALRSPRPDLPVLPNELITHIFSYLGEKELVFVQLVCQRWRHFGAQVLAQYKPDMRAWGSTQTNFKTLLIGKGGLLCDVRSIELAVDKFPFPRGRGGTLATSSILNFILTNRINIELSLGTEDLNTRGILERASKKTHLISGFNKMHNKVWVLDKEGVFLGSPNVSFSGMEQGNHESCILIKSPRVGALFSKYLRLLQMPDHERHASSSNSLSAWDAVELDLRKYNAEAHDLKIALAPIMNITDFIVQNLEGATKIVIRQFLISPKKDRGRGLDILSILCGMAKSGVEIEVVLDKAAYDEFLFVRQATERLLSAGCEVILQTPCLVVDSGHEKIMHDKLILATLHTGVVRTLLGSAGFTKDVIANTNAESFICTSTRQVFDSLMGHHNKSKEGRGTWTFK